MSDFDFLTHLVATGGAVKTRGDVEQLVKVGITHIVDVWGEEDHSEILRATDCGRRIVAFRPPAMDDDGSRRPTGWFSGAIEFALDALRVPRTKVLVHCAEGINRGPSVAYAILRAQGFTESEALRLINVHRPKAQIRYRDDAERAVREMGWV